MKITTKLRLLAVMPVALTMLVVGTVATAAHLIDRAVQQERAAKDMVSEVFALNVLVNEYLYQSELSQSGDRPRQQWLARHDRLISQLADTSTLADPRRLNQAREHHGDLRRAFYRISANRQRRASPGSDDDERLTEIEQALVGQLLNSSEDFCAAVSELAESSRDAARRAQRVAYLVALVLIAASIPVLLTTSGLITRSITKPIARLQEGAQLIGRGDLTHRVGTTAQDEVGQLSRTFDQMVIDLKSGGCPSRS